MGTLLIWGYAHVKPVLDFLKAVPVRAMAHITGGGLTGNLPRVLPAGYKAVIERWGWTVPPVFALIRESGKIAEDEMFKTFNMGIGLVDHVRGLLASFGETAWVIGEVQSGSGGVEYTGGRS